MDFDIFNGDADGICALHQWRLANPAHTQLITGTKRDIQLLDKVKLGSGDTATVFDISFDSNRVAVLDRLECGARLCWFDHHFAGELPVHPSLELHIDTAADVCTSLIVDAVLGYRYRPWAVVAAFGDNLHKSAISAAEPLGLPGEKLAELAELGELLNYNGYGDTIDDLHFVPDQLYRLIAPYSNPFEFISDSPAFKQLRDGFAADISAAEALAPCLNTPHAAAWLLPNAAWARRVIGVLANKLAMSSPDRAHTLLVPNSSGTYTVSVRAPINRAEGADGLCRRFPGGGGRKAAAGINRLPTEEIDRYLVEFSDAFGAR